MHLSDITENETESSAIFLNAAKGKSKRERKPSRLSTVLH